MSDSSATITETTVEDLASREPGFGTGALVRVVVDHDEFAGWLIIERNDNPGYDHVNRHCSVVSADPVSVVISAPVSEVKVQSWSLARDGAPEWAQALAAASWQLTRAEKAVADTHRALVRHQERLESIVDAAHVYADENNLCSVFDDFMDENGLRPRSRDYAVTVDVTVRVELRLSGRDADEANESITDDDIASAIYNMSRSEVEYAVRENDVVDTEAI